MAGATWAGDQEHGVQDSPAIGRDEVYSGYFERLGARTEIFFEKGFTAWGTYCAKNPWLILFLGTN